TPIVTLLEGNTPLVPAPRLAEATDPSLAIFLKCEGFNPTGSFKDRGMTMAMSKAVEAGSRAVICASTGNTSASAAAFAARAGLRAFVMVPRGYREYHRDGKIGSLPRMVGFQAAGAAPIYENRVIEEPRTVATAIKIGNPASWGPALEAMKDSRGWIDIVTDEEILRAYRMLAREEGIFM